MRKRLLLLTINLMLCTLAWCALPTAGKNYRLINKLYPEYVMAENYTTELLIGAKKGTKTDYEQMWLWTGNSLQNVYTGHYVQPQGSTSNQFRMGTSTSNMTLTAANDGTVKVKCGGNTMHCDASKNVVKWEPEADASYWTFEEVTLTEAEIAAARAEYEAYAQKERDFANQLTALQNANYSALSTFFADNACTQLKANYASMDDASLKAAVAAAGLPEAIQNIALKVKNNWGDETDGNISAQFRVQDYQAYSAAGPWRWRSNDTKGLEASQINDMCNPTGVYTCDHEVLFVFVDGEVPSGCELRLSAVDEGISGFGYNNYDNGTVLQQGINVIGASNQLKEYWIMYSVVNKNLKPADMPRLKIHIEGGHVMGYVNAQGKDEATCNAEYEKILRAANKSAEASGADKCRLRLATKGNYGMFYWQIMTYNRIWSDGSAALLVNNPKVKSNFETEKWTSNYKYGFKIWKSMKFYDDVLKQEWGLMGFTKYVFDATQSNPIFHCFGGEDLYPTYCNNLAYTIMGTAGGNPHSSTGYTHMPGIGAVESSYNAERADFDTWCVGHESGHNNQGSINLESSTESSNNLFSNVITYLYGYRMSRGGTFADNMNYAHDKVVFSWRDIGMTMRMYYNLYLYYHRAGHKQDFYPTLFYNLRRDPIRLGTTATTSWLHFYKKACEAAQEDLTEYFRHWGFFIPVTNGEFGDYTNRTVTCTQADIDAAIAWVKSHNWPENKGIIYIEDRVQPVLRTDLWATAGSVRPDNSGNMRNADYLKSTWGDLGHFTEFMEGGIQNAEGYSYAVSGQTIQMTGKGGVGFCIYNAAGEAVYRSNKLKFNIPADLATQEFTVKAVNADGSEVETTNETGTAQYREALQNAITTAAQYTSLLDESGTKMGYYTPDQLAALQELVARGKEILTNNEESSYQSQYRAILEEAMRIENEESVQKVNESGLYTIQSNRNKTKYLNGTTTLATATTKLAQQQWAFIPTKTADTYYMQNVKTLKYVKAKINSSNKLDGWTVDADATADASTFTLETAGSGSFYIKTNDVTSGNYYLNCDPQGALAVWSADDGSKWNLVRVAEIEAYSDADVKDLVNQTTNLVSTVATVEVTNEKLPLQDTDANGQYYVTTNATTGVDENHNLSCMIDGKSTTYFSTVGATVKAKRFFTINMGEGNEMTDLKLYYRTANNNHTLKPAKMTVKTGASTSGLSTLATLTDLPVNTTAAQTYTSPMLKPSKPARIWRFTVEETNNSNPGSYPDFALSYINIYAYTTNVIPNEGYDSIDKTIVKEAKDEAEKVTAELKNKPSFLEKYYIYQELQSAYDKLSQAADAATGITGVASEGSAQRGIFDLQGRRLQQTGQAGIYIINGKKVIIK